MKMSKNYKKLCFVLGLSTVFSAGIVDAANYTTKLNATYKNIRVSYNGTIKSIDKEPFAIDGSTYVPVRAIGELVGANVTWDGPNNLIKITSTASNTVPTDNSAQLTLLQQQLQTSNYNLALAQREVETLKAELATYKNNTSNPSSSTGTSTGTSITSEQLTATEDYLVDNYSEYFRNIEFDFDLRKSSSYLVLTISYDTRNENTAYDELSQTKIDTFIEKVCDEIANRHADIDIEGTIEYTKSSAVEKASFEYNSKKDKVTTDYGLSQKALADIVYDVKSSIELQGFVNVFSISDVQADIATSSSGTSIVKLYINDNNMNNFKDTWNANINSTYTLIRQLDSIIEEINLEYDDKYDVDIALYRSSSNTKIADLDGSRGTITMYTNN